MRRLRTLAAVTLLIVPAGLAACGGDGGTETVGVTTSAPPPPPVAQAVTPAERAFGARYARFRTTWNPRVQDAVIDLSAALDGNRLGPIRAGFRRYADVLARNRAAFGKLGAPSSLRPEVRDLDGAVADIHRHALRGAKAAKVTDVPFVLEPMNAAQNNAARAAQALRARLGIVA